MRETYVVHGVRCCCASIQGGMMEEWHQKLHNNTSPDDVVICEVRASAWKPRSLRIPVRSLRVLAAGPSSMPRHCCALRGMCTYALATDSSH